LGPKTSRPDQRRDHPQGCARRPGAIEFVPVLGTPAAAINTGMYLVEGDVKGAAVAAIGLIPFAKLAKAARAAYKARKAARLAEQSKKVVQCETAAAKAAKAKPTPGPEGICFVAGPSCSLPRTGERGS